MLLKRYVTSITLKLASWLSFNACFRYMEFFSFFFFYYMILQEAKKSRNGKAPHSAWCNYDDLNEYFWYGGIRFNFWNNCEDITSLVYLKLILPFGYNLYIFRSSHCFSLGWPMRDDGDFFKSTRDLTQVLQAITVLFSVSFIFLYVA